MRPKVVGEFEDSALTKVLGAEGFGLFAAPTAVEGAVVAQYGVRRIGLAEPVRERFYAISADRRLRHPAVVHITESARGGLFAAGAAEAPARPRRRR